MKRDIILLLFFSVITVHVEAQSDVIGTRSWNDHHTQRSSDPSVQNGNASLNTIYDSTACGLNYTQVSVKLGQRFTPAGITQPAPMNLSGIPFCASIEKAYLWCVGAGNNDTIIATITNPSGTTAQFPMTIVGQDVDMCWGYTGSFVYRADVTSIVNGMGTYLLSGIPVASGPTDINGATLLAVYQDPFATYTGSLHIDDGASTINGGTDDHFMTGFNSCANATSGNAFMIVADLQNLGSIFNINNGPSFTVNEDWYNFISSPTLVAQAQDTCQFTINSSGDCYCFAVAGLYSQTSCSTCTPMSSSLVISPSVTSDNCNGNGTATVSVTGGNGNYSYQWFPGGQTTAGVNGLSAGSYTVSVTDGVSCSSAVIAVPYTGMTITVATVDVTCSQDGSAIATITGSNGPFTYVWSPGGQTTSSINGLASGTYTLNVVDQSSGCSMNTAVTILNNSNLNVTLITAPDSCTGPSGMATVQVTGGTGPYTYLWTPGGSTNDSITGLTAGTYTCLITDNGGCQYTALAVIGYDSMDVQATASGYFGCGSPILLNAYCTYPNATYSWSPSTGLSAANIQDPIATLFTDMTYTVIATSACGTDSVVITINLDINNQHNEQICFVTNDTTINKNVIIWERNNSPAFGHYNIYKETSTPGVYALIASQPLVQFTTYTDMSSNAQNAPDRYEISTVDSCGNESVMSAHHRTIYLQSFPNVNGGFDLLWNSYEGQNIVTYQVYRRNATTQFTLIATLNGNAVSYTDANPPAGINQYLVEAVHPASGCNPSRYSNPQAQTYAWSLSDMSTADPNGIVANDLLHSSLQLFPNPNDGHCMLHANTGTSAATQISITDGTGRVVCKREVNAGNGELNVSLDVTDLNDGVYFVEISTKEGKAVTRLVIAR